MSATAQPPSKLINYFLSQFIGPIQRLFALPLRSSHVPSLVHDIYFYYYYYYYYYLFVCYNAVVVVVVVVAAASGWVISIPSEQLKSEIDIDIIVGDVELSLAFVLFSTSELRVSNAVVVIYT